MKVLVIPEDSRGNDESILKPIVEAMMAEIGKPRATVKVCHDPLLGGIGEALKWERIEEILELYPMIDLFLLCVDRDDEAGRATRLRELECKSLNMLKGGRVLLAENAWQEIEVWVLAGMKNLPREWNWKDIRSERDPKEVYFRPYAQSRKLASSPGGGAKTLGQEAALNYKRICQKCPEDVEHLENRTREWLKIFESSSGGNADRAAKVHAWMHCSS